jgi:hypothetical protein
MNYFQRLWTKTPLSNKITLAVLALVIDLIPIFCLCWSLSLPPGSKYQTFDIVVSVIAVPLFLLGIPFALSAQDLAQIEKREKEVAKDQQDFLNDEDGYLEGMAERVITEIEFDMEIKELTDLQKRKFVNKILYKIVSHFRGLGKEKEKI